MPQGNRFKPWTFLFCSSRILSLLHQFTPRTVRSSKFTFPSSEPTLMSYSNLINGSPDEDPPRTPWRTGFLFLVYLCRILGSFVGIYYLQGQDFLRLWLPCCIMSSIYPLVKRIKALRQLVLAASVGSVLLPAWISSGGKLEWREDIILIGLFTMFWIIYIDILHKAMVHAPLPIRYTFMSHLTTPHYRIVPTPPSHPLTTSPPPQPPISHSLFYPSFNSPPSPSTATRPTNHLISGSWVLVSG